MKRLFRFGSINDANEGRLDVQRHMKPSSSSSSTSNLPRARSNSKVTAAIKSNSNNSDPTQLKCLFNIHIFALEDFDLMTLASSLEKVNESGGNSNLGRSSSFGNNNSGNVSIHTLGHKMFHNYSNNEPQNGNETSRSTNSGISSASQRSEDSESIAVSNALMKLLQSRYSIHWKVLQNNEEESSISSLFSRSGSNSFVIGGATEPANVISKTCSNDAIFEDYDYINTCWSRSMSPSTNPNSTNQNSPNSKKNSIIYLADFKDYEYDFVCDFKPKKEKPLTEIINMLNSNNGSGSGSGSQEDPFLPFYVKNMQSLLEDKPLVLEIRELKSSGSGRITSDKRSGFVKLNLTDFVTPPHMIYCGVGSMSRTILVPVKLSIEAPSNSPLVLTAKLRMQISSMWLTDSISTRERQTSKTVPTAPKYDTFFLIDENESYLVPDSLVNGQTTTRSNDSVSSAPISIKSARSFNGSARIDSENTPPQIVFPQLPPESPPRKNSGGNNTITISPLMVKKFSSNNNLSVMNNSNSVPYSPTKPFSENSLATSIQQEKLDMKIKQLEDSLKMQQATVREEIEHVKKDMEDLYSILEIIEAEKEGYCKMSIPEVSLNASHETKFFDIEERLKYFVYCDLQGCNQLWSIPHEDITKSVSIYFDVLRRCLKENMGMDTTPAVKHDEFHNIVSDSVVCGFETARQALKFSLLVQTKMMDADWPDSLLSLEGICTYQKNNIKLLFRGLRCRMGISARSKKFTDSTLQAIRRASMIAQYAQGGQTLAEAQVMENLAIEKQNNTLPPDTNTIESLVQRLDNCVTAKSGLKNTTLFLVIPNSLKERRFKDLKRQNSFPVLNSKATSSPTVATTPTTTSSTMEEATSPSNSNSVDASEFPTNESSLVNVLYSKLSSLKDKFRNDIQQKTKEIDMTIFKLQSLLETFRNLLADKGDKDAFQIVENQFGNQFKELSEELSELKDIQTTNLRTKMKSYETELLRMSMQLLDIRVASPLLTFRTAVLPEPEISQETTIESIESTLSQLHDTPEEPIITTSPITPRTTVVPGEKLNRHLLDLMEHNNLMKRKIQMLSGNDDSCSSPTAENISI
ncbi:predicted protein [Naegleria gruberi]|uniref:Predicted protein n=1 Tax=Naegleria gruberi TaxID=5762 RepID=D2VSI6_NAEGR|nr:uncharacterized protein NAEGRDRAFT_51913 [Naegleria gruberi]EFC40199.1 predicted protein [Naegleria gruberi]|eukprot:XP_002672943.1 predicted protein [Naegleria gruberi strain NEG-M]